MIWFLPVLVFLIFRWPILKRVLSIAHIWLFDAVMFTVFAATNAAAPGQWPWLSYLIGGMCGFLAMNAGKKYLELARNKDDQGKSNTKPTE